MPAPVASSFITQSQRSGNKLQRERERSSSLRRIRGGNRDVRESADDVARGAAKGEEGGGRREGEQCGRGDCEAAHTGQGENFMFLLVIQPIQNL